ncbi:efflux RND transporter periplasmic adaptor subunit [Ulvibacter litoralis]|uniref:RND family efflux transporter, MFP subunit n=1 Tax=Ulvibacter litoralis TaxID=227084 RepID=A0A1G7DQG3_9FLAO|nr:efflux RND transporter periplasmic adaptor subunit [Ulvibacter litoralis]GHC42809.1 RND transporter [Ulvibacter litoralis]SDE53085.1 RND family efflux transporter, MFP subunit [Ulvibacter litoralis]
MKKIILILLTAITVASCGGDGKSLDAIIESGNLEAIHTKRNEIVAEQIEINNKIKQIDVAIAKLDTVKKLPLVTAFEAKQKPFNHFLELQGNVETKKNIILYPEYSGLLTRVYVKEGQKVTKGQLLASIDDGGLSQQVAQMEVQANLAKTTFERQQRLWEQKIGSEIEYLQSKANYEGQQKSINQMRSQVAKTSIRAPFSGIIDDVKSEQGTVVSAGQSEVFRLVNLNDMYIEVEIPESYLSDVVPGKTVEVNFPVLNETIQTKVSQVGNYINPGNRTFKIEVNVPNKAGNIKPNLTAKVKINDYTNPEAILIPQSVISENADGEQYVYVTTRTGDSNEATANRKIVVTGKTEGDFVEINSGISKGDTIISEGARSVKEGQTVKILSVNNDE